MRSRLVDLMGMQLLWRLHEYGDWASWIDDVWRSLGPDATELLGMHLLWRLDA